MPAQPQSDSFSCEGCEGSEVEEQGFDFVVLACPRGGGVELQWDGPAAAAEGMGDQAPGVHALRDDGEVLGLDRGSCSSTAFMLIALIDDATDHLTPASPQQHAVGALPRPGGHLARG